MLKLIGLILLCLIPTSNAFAQQPLSNDDALRQLYGNYNAKTTTAAWSCTDKQTKELHSFCSYVRGKISVEVLLSANVRENGIERAYFVTSAIPATITDYTCHACTPAIGVIVFALQGEQWNVESANAAVGVYGGWGDPPEVELMKTGPQRHGIMLSGTDMAQGYAWSWKRLLLPIGKTVKDAWNIEDEQDDAGAYDPTDKYSAPALYRATATLRFDRDSSYVTGDGTREYYDIEVISHGTGMDDATRKLVDENWTEIYRFSNGEYKLLRHTNLKEIKSAAKTTTPSRK